MKRKLFIFLVFIFYLVAQSAVIEHVYGSKHLQTSHSCTQCVFLNQTSGADVPQIAAFDIPELQTFYTQNQYIDFVLSPLLFAYFSQAPPYIEFI
ncbi:MAG: hypothetical protein LBR70_03590 [Lactobacillaceae bacterium]|jgi:hypothetical protein|nr:hypothetical protein [Lactobacillaceae bacterium]